MGFTFNDTDTKGVASSIAEMHRLIEKDPRNAERIFPYIGGDEVNDNPTQAHHRYVINFADFPLRREDFGKTWRGADEQQRQSWLRAGIVPLDYPHSVAADWPDLLEIVERRVKPERTKRKSDGSFALREPLPTRWWQYADKRPALHDAIKELEQVLVCSLHQPHWILGFLPSNAVYSHALGILALNRVDSLALLQSRIHEAWARFFGSSLEDRLRYTPSDCFETFPFPPDHESNPTLEIAGQTYYDYRAELMVRNNEGLTKTYNRFHDPDESSPGILTLRELHAAMDRAVLDAYGWQDIPTDCVFLLDYEDEEDDEPTTGRASRKKKPWRYRWPDEVRDEVLARLLALNAERAAEEERAGLLAAAAAAAPRSKPHPGKEGKAKTDDRTLSLDL